jgi:hypothetical protein
MMTTIHIIAAINIIILKVDTTDATTIADVLLRPLALEELSLPSYTACIYGSVSVVDNYMGCGEFTVFDWPL